jgi:hypothetical protein
MLSTSHFDVGMRPRPHFPCELGWHRLQTAGTSAKMLTLKGVSIASTCTSAARASAMIPYVVRRSRCLLREKTYGVSSSFFSGFDVR